MVTMTEARSHPGALKIDRGIRFLGFHVLIDMWVDIGLDDPSFIKVCLLECADACGATVLHTNFHHFGDGGGVTGVVVLAESHITVHSWPEHGYAAFDVFVCGTLDPYLGIDTLMHNFRPKKSNIVEHRRGLSINISRFG